MTIRIQHGELYLTEVRTRMPFKYGIATMTRAPHAFVRLHVEVNGRASSGVAADTLAPKWFTKDPARSLADEIDELLRVIDNALDLAQGLRGGSAFEVWRQLHDTQTTWGEGQFLPPLLYNFGTTLVERALLEAVGRATGRSFAEELRGDAFGLDLGLIHRPLAGLRAGDFLPARARDTVLIRHTVGLADPITDADIPAGERLDDGLPQSLAASQAAYGLRHFKIKVSGDLDRDADRLRRIAAVLGSQAPVDYAFSLDGNEQFHALAAFRSFWEALQRDPTLTALFGHLLFVEQPFHRNEALDPGTLGGLKDWPDRPALIIDESDGELDSLPRALGLGYAGTSHKNCKGVFKGVANACLLEHRRRTRPDLPAQLSGEDLVNIGPVALLQDLAVAASLGVSSIERNGHHYFTGLSFFPEAVRREVLAAHGDLYRRHPAGWPTLDIRDGRVRLDSVIAAPLGVGFALPVELFEKR